MACTLAAMPLPVRLRLPSPDEADVRAMSELCDAIENAAISNEPELTTLLAQWNARATRAHEAIEFRTYYGAMSTRAFVLGALSPAPRFDPDLTFGEAVAVVEAISRASLDDWETTYFVGWLDAQFVGGQASDLIFWPNVWFREEAALSHPFTAEQLVHALSLRSGRTLPGARAAELPFRVPLPIRL